MAEDEGSEDALTVKITSLSYEADLEDVKQIFKHVPGMRCRIEYESEASKRHRGTAYAVAPDRAALTQALACDREEVRGREVKVKRLVEQG